MTKRKKPEELLKVGRPEIPYSKEIAEHICLLIAITPQSLNYICRDNEDLPSVNTIYSWMWKYPEFLERYWDARRAQAIALADKTLEIADASGDAKLKITNIQWHVGRLLPKIFGEKLDVSQDLKQTVEQLEESIQLLKKHEKEY